MIAFLSNSIDAVNIINVEHIGEFGYAKFSSCAADRLQHKEARMKKRWRKLTALLMTAVAATTLAGCGGGSSSGGGETTASDTAAQSGDLKEVNIMMGDIYSMTGTKEVEDAINEIIESKYGMHFNIQWVQYGNLQQQTNLALTSDEIDIFQGFGLLSYINNGQITDLTDYLANTDNEKMKNLFSENLKTGCSFNGRLYGLPKVVDYGHYYGLSIDEDIAAEYGAKNDDRWTLEECDAFFAWVAEKHPEMKAIAPNGTQIIGVNGFSWDQGGAYEYGGVLPNYGADSTTFECLWDNEDFINCAKWCRKWYEAGYVTADILSNTQSAEAVVSNGQAACYFDCWGVNNKQGMIHTVVVEHWTDSGAVAQNMYMINGNSKDKDAAWKAMEILYTDEEVGKIFYNGIEGRDYIMNDDGTLSYPDGKDATNVPYGASNLSWLLPWAANGGIAQQINGATFYDDTVAFNETGTFSKANGFQFDYSQMTDAYTAVANAYQKYYTTILSGAVDVDSTLEQAREAYKAAGYEELQAEKQRQFDAFLAAQE